jgi:hypothetical protein
MAEMNDSKREKGGTREILRHIEDALIQSVLEASGDELRAEIKEVGDDPSAYIALADSIMDKARGECSKYLLDRAKAQASAFKSAQIAGAVPFNRDKLIAKLKAEETSNPPEMMLAARKGKKLSSRDEDAVLRARARLYALENGKND